jgi:DNA-binding LacI/PurR family transcriptional regulator
VAVKQKLAPATSLRDLGKHLGLSPTTVSLVLNGSPGAASIPKETQDRVFAAAKRLNYRPNYFARSLRSRRTYLTGVMVPEVGEGYAALVLSGIEEALLARGWAYLLSTHRHHADRIENGQRVLYERCVEGLIAVDTPIEETPPVPVVAVSGHGRTAGVTNVVLDHDHAAELGLRHLVDLGHREIAFFVGQAFSSDSEVRWSAIHRAAVRMGLHMKRPLVVRLEGDSPSPETGYHAARQLLATGEHFTALWAFNDISAIGGIRALIEAGRSVPGDVSVLGFDDVYGAAFHNPALTTVRQPLARIGAVAVETLLERIDRPDERHAREITVAPDLVVRESTGPARG